MKNKFFTTIKYNIDLNIKGVKTEARVFADVYEKKTGLYVKELNVLERSNSQNITSLISKEDSCEINDHVLEVANEVYA